MTKSLSRQSGAVYEASASDQFYTPFLLREAFWSRFGVPSWDPATSDRNPMRARVFDTKLGLQALAAACENPPPFIEELVSNMWFNPPYGRDKTPEWCAALERVHARYPAAAHSVSLLPCRTGTEWYVALTDPRLPTCAQALCELNGRVRFEDYDGKPYEWSARWSAVLVYRGPTPRVFKRWADDYGVVRMLRRLRLPRVPKASHNQLRLL